MMSRLAIVIAAIVFCVYACGGPAPQGSPDSGAVAFSVAWDTDSATSKVFMAPPPGADVCSYYQITTINAQVTTGSGQHLTSASWPCSAHGGTINNVPIGVVNVIIEAVVGATTAWRGQLSGITVASGRTTNAGTATVFYVGNDVTQPWVSSTTPTGGATQVAQTATVSAVFSENIVSASVNTASFTLTCGTAIPGTIAYAPLSRTATFTPSSSLPEATNCTAVITTDVEDLAGLQIASNYQWSFLTVDLTAPAVVTGLAATGTSSSQIDLQWSPSSDNVALTGYRVYRGGTFVTTVTATNYADTGRAASTQYCYTVTAIDAANNESGQSTQICATTQEPPIVPPSAPLDLIATAISATSISLSWTDNSNNETLFRIERSSTSGSSGFVEIATVAANATNYSNTGLTSSTAYWYRIRAYNTAGNSGYSNVASAITLAPPIPSAPTGVSVTGGSSQATISWTASPGIVSSYTVYYSTTDPVTTASPTRRTGITSTSTTITNLTNGTAYFFIVTAVNSAGESVASTPQVWTIPGVTAGATWTIQTSGTTDRLDAITSSSYQIVAVGGNVSTYYDTVLTSPDGTTWTPSTTGNTNTHFYGIAYGNTTTGARFVAVGQNGAIFSSSNATLWTRHLTGNTSFLLDITWSGTQFVAVGANGAILTSPDGINWTIRTSGTTNSLYGVVWSGTQFVAVGFVGTILTSPDGITWTIRSSAGNNLSSVTWSGTEFVAVGYNGTIITSPNGVTWTNRTSGTIRNLYDIVWSGTQFVAVGSLGTILASPNGITWTSRMSGTTDELQSVDWRSRFVAVGWNGRILTSQ